MAIKEIELTPADVADTLYEFGPAQWEQVRHILWKKRLSTEERLPLDLDDLEPLPTEPPPTPEGDEIARAALKRMRGVIPITDPDLTRWLAESFEL